MVLFLKNTLKYGNVSATSDFSHSESASNVFLKGIESSGVCLSYLKKKTYVGNGIMCKPKLGSIESHMAL